MSPSVRYSKEIQVLVVAAVCGLVLLLPRVYLEHKLHQQSPSSILFKSLEDTVQKVGLKGGLKFKRVKAPAKSFKPKSKKESHQTKELRLEGIIYDEGGDSTAVINDEIVKAGDSIGDFTVLDIKKREVILRKEGSSYRLSSQGGLQEIKTSTSETPLREKTGE